MRKILLLLAVSSLANPWLGTWTLDSASSRLAGPVPRELRIEIAAADARRVEFTVAGTAAAGTPFRDTFGLPPRPRPPPRRRPPSGPRPGGAELSGFVPLDGGRGPPRRDCRSEWRREDLHRRALGRRPNAHRAASREVAGRRIRPDPGLPP